MAEAVAQHPVTRYARTVDGVSIAYQSVGSGPLDVVLVPGFVSNVDFYWEHPGWTRILSLIAEFARLILWDKRCTGLSDPVARVPTLDERVDDLTAVMDAAGVERAALFGVSEGGLMASLFAAAHPQRVAALALYGTSPKFAASDDWPWGWKREEINHWFEDLERNWGQGALLSLFAPSQAGNPRALDLWGRYQRAGASPAMGRAVLEALVEIDCREIVASVQAPTLIMHRAGDLVARVEAARFLAQRIPNALLVEFEGPDHLITIGNFDPIIAELTHFLTGIRPSSPTSRVLATVLFTDIVGSTTRAVELGDQRWRELLESHRTEVRQQLEIHDGREVTTTGDGFLAVFSAPSRAIAAAQAINDATRPLGLELRAGIHTGECETMGNDVGGVAVHIGARVAAAAGPNEVLVSSTVRDLVAGAEVPFEDRGEHELKGIPGQWRLYAVGS
jgi:class 3 adenylate cyclase/pimeloyl-ACP methyl ester carboxylesterase